MAGWFSVHRKIKDSVVFADPFILKLWMLCLVKVSYTEHEQLVGTQVVKLNAGEFVTGRFALAEEYNKGASPKNIVNAITVWRWLKLLEKLEMLNIKTTNKFSVVTVINWHLYQSDEQQMNNKRTTDEQQMFTNNKGNKGNKENKKDSRHKQAYAPDSDYFILADFFYKEILKNNPDHKEPNLQTWADEFRKVVELDNREKSEVSRLIRWVQQDDFEMANVLSPAKLRKRYDNLALKMKKGSGNFHHVPTAKPKEYVPDFSAGED